MEKHTINKLYLYNNFKCLSAVKRQKPEKWEKKSAVSIWQRIDVLNIYKYTISEKKTNTDRK